MLAATPRTHPSKTIMPLVRNHHAVPTSSIRFSSACFAGPDWSLAQLRKPADAAKNKVFATNVAAALKCVGAIQAYAPNPTKFNGEIVKQADLNVLIKLPNNITVHRQTDKPADGAPLARAGDAGMFSAGGCAMLVMASPEHIVFAHAGRDCVLDRARVLSEGNCHGRKHQSIVDTIIRYLRKHDALAKDIHVWPMYSIKPAEFVHTFDHERHAAYNQAAGRYIPAKYGDTCCAVTRDAIEIDVPNIIQSQCLGYGIPEKQIYLDHAYLADELPHTRKDAGGRYLVTVVRHR